MLIELLPLSFTSVSSPSRLCTQSFHFLCPHRRLKYLVNTAQSMPRRCSYDRALESNLEQALAHVDMQMSASRQPLRTHQKAAKRKLAQEKKAWTMTPFLTNVILVLYSLAGYSSDLAMPFLMQKAREREWPEKDEDSIRHVVRDIFLEVDDNWFLALCNENDSSDKAAYREALNFKDNFEAMSWCEDMNRNHGLAPASASVLQRFHDNNEQRQEELQSYIPMNFWTSSPRVFVHRWRQYWGAKFGRLRIVPNLSTEEIQNKVRALIWIQICTVSEPFFSDFFNPKKGTENRPSWGTQNTAPK